MPKDIQEITFWKKGLQKVLKRKGLRLENSYSIGGQTMALLKSPQTLDFTPKEDFLLFIHSVNN